MVLITVALPDKITRRVGGSYSEPEFMEYNINEGNLKLVLGRPKDYHDEYYFKDTSKIRIIKKTEIAKGKE